MLLPSGNDAAEALAGSHPRGRAAFIAAANRKAAALGARDTVMVTPSGLTARGAHSSAADLLVLLRAAQASPVVRPILAMSSYRLGPVGGRTHVVRRATDYVNKYPTAQGKSGYTSAALNTLVVNTPINGRHIGVALLGAPYGKSTSGARALTLWASANRSRLATLAHLPASAPTSPAPTPKPTPVPTPKPTPVPTPTPKPTRPRPRSRPRSRAHADAEADADPGPDADADPDPEADPGPDADPGSHPVPGRPDDPDQRHLRPGGRRRVR